MPADSAELRRMAQKIDELPLLPQVLVRILQIDADADDYFEQLEELVGQDPPLAVRLIAAANSASSAPQNPIKSIRDAMARIGARAVTNLVASLSVQRVFVPRDPSQTSLWKHSVRVAAASDHLARTVPALGIDPGEAYLTGLLHDIGRFVMLEHAPAELQLVEEANWGSPASLVAADVDVFKYTHSELGYLACQHWGLPEATGDVVRQHHTQICAPPKAGSVQATTLLVQVADRLDMALLGATDREELSAEDQEQRLEAAVLCCGPSRKLWSTGALLTHHDRLRPRCDDLLAALGLGN